MTFLTHIGITALFIIASIYSFYNYIPIGEFIHLEYSGKLGAVTELSSTDSLSDFPTLYNANLGQLMRMSTTTNAAITSMTGLTTAGSLVTVGALSSGSLTTGFTAVNVAQGGTGSTTLSSNQILLGNGTTMKTVSGWGTSGQFLTSGGAGNAPTWTTSSVDETLSYNFTGTYFGAKNLYASSTSANPLVLNTLSLNTPSSLPSASSTLIVDSSGNITFGAPKASSTVFTSSGTWVRPTGVNSVLVTVVGGGAGGGSADPSSGECAAGGGGAGGYAHGTVSVSGNVTVTIGAGGAGGSTGAAGTNGGNSSFIGDDTIGSNGGTGGTGCTNDNEGSAGGAGGAATTTVAGVIGLTGQAGKTGIDATNYPLGGVGGSNPLGFGGHGANVDAVGGAASGCGGGGGGAADDTADRDGGAGADGCVIVTWFK